MERRAKVGVMRGSYDEKRKTIDGMCVPASLLWQGPLRADRASELNPRRNPSSLMANGEAYRTLVGKEIDERMMDRFVSTRVRDLEDEVRAKTTERAEIDRKVTTQKANLTTERDKIRDKAQEVTGA
jgi:hypothetical protein